MGYRSMRKSQVKVGDRYWVNVAARSEPTACVEVEVLGFSGGRWDCRVLESGQQIRVTTARFRSAPDRPSVGSAKPGEAAVLLSLRVPEDLRDQVRAIPGWQERVRVALAEIVAS